MSVDKPFWRGKRVLMTGHTGFKGAWLTLWLKQLGADVTGLADGVPTTPSLFGLAGLRDAVPTRWADVRDVQAVLHAVRRSPEARSVVNVTSDKCYDNHAQGRPFREDDPMGSHDPYSRSKGCTERVAERWPGELRWAVDDGPRPHEAGLLLLDSSKARERLGWTPRWNLAEGLNATIAWYAALHGSADMREVSPEQISAFAAITA